MKMASIRCPQPQRPSTALAWPKALFIKAFIPVEPSIASSGIISPLKISREEMCRTHSLGAVESLRDGFCGLFGLPRHCCQRREI